MTPRDRPDSREVDAIARRVREGEAEPLEPLREAVERITRRDRGPDGLQAFLSVADPDGPPPGETEEGPGARDREPGGAPLAGVPVGVKDNLATLDLPTTCGSRLLEGYRSPYEATVVRRLRRAGATVAGKTNMDEFAMGSSTENSAFGPTLHPRVADRVPGGSSGGSAAAVAAGLVPVALGSDTGGSVRQPASFCGIVGIKPTYGRVSRYGLVSYASSLDQVGTLGRTVRDAAHLLQAVAGHDRRDATSAPRPVPDLLAAEEEGRGGDLEGTVVGVPSELFPDSLDHAVAAPCRTALRLLEELGAEVREVSLPRAEVAVPTYYVLAPAEASSNLARYDGVRFGRRSPEARSAREVYERSRSEGFGPEVVRRIILGTFALSTGYYDAYYGRAHAVRQRLASDFRRVFASGVDLLFGPTHPTVAFPRGESHPDPYQRYLRDAFTVPANLAGVPALSLPVGSAGALPVGGQLMSPRWGEAALVRAAACLERALGSEGSGEAS